MRFSFNPYRLFTKNERNIFPSKLSKSDSVHDKVHVIDDSSNNNIKEQQQELSKVTARHYREPYVIIDKENSSVENIQEVSLNKIPHFHKIPHNKLKINRRFLKFSGYKRTRNECDAPSNTARNSDHTSLKKNSYILKDSNTNDYVLLHLRDVLSDSAVKGKATIFTLETETPLRGWNKSCGASGTLRINNLIHQLKHQVCRDSLGINDNQIESLHITNTMGSGRIQYKNSKKQDKSFQIGNHIIRENHSTYNSSEHYCNLLKEHWNKHYKNENFIETEEDIKQNIQDYYDELDKIYDEYSHLFNEITDDVTANHYYDNKHHFVSTNMNWAINFLINNKSEIAIHLDPEAQLPCLLTMDNPLKDDRPFAGGELLINEYAWVANYGPKDIILFRGDKTWHMVLPIQGKPIKNKSHIRASQVFFRNVPKERKKLI